MTARHQAPFAPTPTEVARRSRKFAGVLKSLGVGKGDTVIIYIPMIPEAHISMLACARIGAVHSVVFGGFASNSSRCASTMRSRR